MKCIFTRAFFTRNSYYGFVIYVRKCNHKNLRLPKTKIRQARRCNSRVVKCNAHRGARSFVSTRNFSDSGPVPRFNALMGFIPECAINSSLRLPAVPYLARVFIPRRYSVDTGRRFMPKQLIAIWQEARTTNAFVRWGTAKIYRDVYARRRTRPIKFSRNATQRRRLITRSINISSCTTSVVPTEE